MPVAMYFKYRNNLHTPTKIQKIAEMKNIPYFLPVVYIDRISPNDLVLVPEVLNWHQVSEDPVNVL